MICHEKWIKRSRQQQTKTQRLTHKKKRKYKKTTSNQQNHWKETHLNHFQFCRPVLKTFHWKSGIHFRNFAQPLCLPLLSQDPHHWMVCDLGANQSSTIAFLPPMNTLPGVKWTIGGTMENGTSMKYCQHVTASLNCGWENEHQSYFFTPHFRWLPLCRRVLRGEGALSGPKAGRRSTQNVIRFMQLHSSLVPAKYGIF